MKFGEKISKLLKINSKKFSTIEDLERFAGIGPKTLRKAVQEEREPSRRILVKLLEAVNISEEEWDRGDFAPMLISSSGEMTKNETQTGLIPFYDTVAVGGMALLADQEGLSQPAEMINPGTFLSSATGALRVYGHSMYPKYPAGCIVAFKASSTAIPSVILWGEDYVIELEERRIIKKVDKGDTKEYIKAVSLNGSNGDKVKYQYDTIDIPISAIKRMYMVLGKIELEASI